MQNYLKGKAMRKCKTLFLLLTFITFNAEGKEEDCVKCHVEKKEKGNGSIIDLQFLKNSVHRLLSCEDCHSKAEKFPHTREKSLTVECERCHIKTSETYYRSVHGQKRKEGVKDVPYCSDCHGTHGIKRITDPLSMASRQNIEVVCFRCHLNENITKKYGIPGSEFIKSYTKSTHYEARKGGTMPAATCIDCHGTHDILPSDVAESFISRNNIPADCGKCHPVERRKYSESIHWEKFSQGITEAPVCTDCHGEHTIFKVLDPNSPVNPAEIPYTCAKCHESVVFSKKFKIPPKRLTTYFNTYHGIAIKYGDTTVANCASCHGYHEIYPSSDPRSSVHPSNIVKTCSKCHPGASENFARGKIHIEVSPKGAKGVFGVRLFYIIFISILCLGFIIHIAADLTNKIRMRRVKK